MYQSQKLGWVNSLYWYTRRGVQEAGGRIGRKEEKNGRREDEKNRRRKGIQESAIDMREWRGKKWNESEKKLSQTTIICLQQNFVSKHGRGRKRGEEEEIVQ